MDENSRQEFLLYIKSKQDKFDYAFEGLILASFALSLQFSTSFGKNKVLILFIAWLFYLISSICGGYRLMKGYVFDKNNYYKNWAEDFVAQIESNLRNPAFVEALNRGEVIYQDDGQIASTQNYKNVCNEKKEVKDKAEKLMDDLQKKVKICFKIKLWGYLIALFLNTAFISYNLLINSQSSLW